MKVRLLPVAVLGSLCLLFGAQAAVQAEPAVYNDGELRIDAGIVHLQGKDHLFRDVRMSTLADGTLKLVHAESRRLATVEELELHVVYGAGVEVELTVGGYISTPCAGLEPTAISREGSRFHVLIAETPPDPLALCAQVVQPFSLVVPLDAAGLEPGDYLVLVNNEPMAFTIEDHGV